MTNSLDQIREQLLVLRCKDGDESAFEQLVARHQGRLRYYIRRMDAGDEDDLLQEVWLSVWRHLRKLREPSAFKSWLYQIARSKIYGQIRKRPGFAALDEQAEPAAPSEGPDEFRADEAEMIHKCISKLATEHREALLLRFLGDLSYQEIASVIGRSVGTVRSRIHYAKAALRREMEATSHD